MVKKFIENKGSLPISDAILYDDKYTLEISGQVGIDARTGKLAEGIENQTLHALGKISTILNEIGWNLNNIVKVRVYLTDMKNYSKMNEIYQKYFKKDYPTRVALAVKELPLGALIEIECIACGN
jgi:2-iminobutanoate/2-iminopropanoate deaminase